MLLINLYKSNYEKIISQVLKVLNNGGLVIFPSDTVYGLLCDATNEVAVRKLITFKNRPIGKPISVFCDFNTLSNLVTINNQQLSTLKQILPGPFTIILPSKHKVNKLLESEAGTLGIRIPMYRYIEVLVDQFKKPITATSANIAGRSPHYSIESLLNTLTEKQKKLIDLIVDAGTLPKNKPSTVVDLTESDVKVLRKGDVDYSRSKIFSSKTSEKTKEIARQILKENIEKKDKPLIFIIEGEMGVGKTVFVKGIGKELGINNIISPTFVIYYEYDKKILNIKDQISKMIHVDLYNIQDKREFMDLGLINYLKPGNILCFEWGEKAGEIIELLKSKGEIVYVKMKYVNEKEREIIINN